MGRRTVIGALLEHLGYPTTSDQEGDASPAALELAGGRLTLPETAVAIDDLTATQRKVAEFFLHHTEDCAFLPAVAIAQRSGVSESSVLRFAIPCGFSGFPELQGFVQSLIRDQLSLSGRLERVVASGGRSGNVLRHVIETDMRNLEETLRTVSASEFDRAVQILAGASRVHVLGLRTSASLASLLAVTLRYIGRDAALVDLGVGDFWERLAFMRPDDVMVAISFRSYTSWTQEIIQYVAERGIPIVLITDSLLAPPTRFATASLVVHRSPGTIVESSTAPMSVINALAVGLARTDEAKSMESLRENERLWRTKGVHNRARRSEDEGGGG